ncbi:MAG: hydroxymethylbilane synthase [Candidatus Dactylopiibacterium carminicum]|uniref:Porphobilinogen deaminase n=1 Tax=Candidatus Dactylopiibacterium carminicum TaxID=857335 RepID=A0A272ERC6_9RHOO|nr:hydroxymethylbilane synthase [Candidatus Dactylopiibacterium carminicum]KAF7598740.1 hydroxymethylbilane synthase [Candidatus Dactylopiibacterium carminicum]PAS92651.1 MAG: hydroxymethylbilane synthase [Candidatus Dactylopiibacterium carminicum]PAS96141.1 MAG: hydroxymethylbilane synthase [Candidatus Dactylopiibacterium carminicum]PAS98759.1 MAG: hydroxymethylbilane synthase [Candidatus Dactylopiibacterium carminicum]
MNDTSVAIPGLEPALAPLRAPERIVIATRESRLALWQAEHVKVRLEAVWPGCLVELLGMTTRGDQILDRSLSKVGGKGLFVKELEAALADGRADIAVHSMKDVPAQMPEGFALIATLARETPLDAFVSSRYESLADMPPGAVVGTSSLRREAQIHALHPYLGVSPLRGNLDTRLRKLDEGQFDAIILAAAGLRRLGLGARIRSLLSADESLPAAGQGALGIEARADRPEVAAWLVPLVDPVTARCVAAERAVTQTLDGGCDVPLGAFCEQNPDGSLFLRAFVASPDGSRCVRAQAVGQADDAQSLGRNVGLELLVSGADRILAELRG